MLSNSVKIGLVPLRRARDSLIGKLPKKEAENLKRYRGEAVC